MAVKNHNFRFNEEKEAERQAWGILHSKEVKEDFRSQNEFVIAAINDYYARHLATKQDPYLESREKEDAFVKGIVEAVEKKVLDNLPGLSGMYMMQQPGQGAATVQVPEQGQKQETVASGVTCDNQNYTEEYVRKYEMEPELNELLDFSFCGD